MDESCIRMLALALSIGGCSSAGNDDEARARGGTGAGGQTSAGSGGGGAGGLDGGGASAGGSAGSAGAGGSGGSERAMVGDCDNPPTHLPSPLIFDGCTDVFPGEFALMSVTIPSRGTGPMTSPLVRCERVGDRLYVGGSGLDYDEVDTVLIRLVVENFRGSGAYQGNSSSVKMAVYHSDVATFESNDSTFCEVLIGTDGRSGELQCMNMDGLNTTMTMDFDQGMFRCAELAAVGGGLAEGEACNTVGCLDPSETCSSMSIECESGVCQQSASSTGSCTAGSF